jgi:glycosyltransferase involved in cell wall biosynthesis
MDNTMKQPKVSVIMPVFNGEKYLRVAIDSVLKQTFINFEFIIINDGSTDDSLAIIKSYTDNRIVIINNEKNLQIIETLNRGIEISKGEYIIRMDCDDKCKKNRFELQVDFMNKNPDIGASGCYFNLLLNNKTVKMDSPVSPNEIDCFLLFNSPIAHPTAIIRKSVLIKNKIHYSKKFLHVEDYFLWSEINKYSKLANIPHYLLDYRVHSHQVTKLADSGNEKKLSLLKVRAIQLANLGIDFTQEELLIHHTISDGTILKSKEEIDLSEAWLLRLLKYNLQAQKLNNDYLKKIILERWIRLCINTFDFYNGFFRAMQSDIYNNHKITSTIRYQLLKSFYKSFVRKNRRNRLN